MVLEQVVQAVQTLTPMLSKDGCWLKLAVLLHLQFLQTTAILYDL